MAKAIKDQTTTGGHIKPTQETSLEHPAHVTRESVDIGPQEHFLQKVTRLKLGDAADLLNIWNETQREVANVKTHMHKIPKLINRTKLQKNN